MGSKALFFFFFSFFALASFLAWTASAQDDHPEGAGLVMNFYKDSCPQAEDVIKEQVKLLYKRHKNTAFSWLRNIFHDCAVQVRNNLSLSKYFDEFINITLLMKLIIYMYICICVVM